MGGDRTPRRALEARLAHLVQHPRTANAHQSEFATLVQCRAHAIELVGKELATADVREVATKGIEQWMELATLALLDEHIAVISTLGREEPAIFEALSSRLKRLVKQGFSVRSLGEFVTVVVRLQEQDVQVLSSDLEEALVKKFASYADSWPSERLLEDMFTREVQSLCRISGRIHLGISEAVTRRLANDVALLSRSTKTTEDVPALRRGLAQWEQTTKRASHFQMVSFDTDTRHALVDALSDLTAKMMASRGPTEEIQQMQWSIMMLVSGPQLIGEQLRARAPSGGPAPDAQRGTAAPH